MWDENEKLMREGKLKRKSAKPTAKELASKLGWKMRLSDHTTLRRRIMHPVDRERGAK
jgi:hypothetical protein